jgi:hypothetical protein
LTGRFELEAIDLLALTRALRESCGVRVEGLVVGRTLLARAARTMLFCSELAAEQLVDTLVARGFVREEVDPEGRAILVLGGGSETAGG